MRWIGDNDDTRAAEGGRPESKPGAGAVVEASSSGDGWQYDLFVSYVQREARASSGFTRMIGRLRRTFEARMHREMRIFVDTEAVRSAAIWDQRIVAALNASIALLAVCTPSYFRSEWCCREWDTFLILEQERRHELRLLPYESVIFPVLLAPLPDSPEPDAVRRLAEMNQRQAVDLTEAPPGTAERGRRVDRLAADLSNLVSEVSAQPAEATAADVRDRATPLAATYSGTGERRFVQHLARARSATIVGVASAHLPDWVEAALAEKRRSEGPTAFWDSLLIVFPTEELLPHINDEATADFSHLTDAARHRSRQAGLAKRRLMSMLLRLGIAGRWALHTYPYLLPLVGSLFVMANGGRVVQLTVSRPSRPPEDELHVELLDRVAPSFEAVFQEVIEASREEHEVVLVGVPQSDHKFSCQSARFRRAVMGEGRNTSDWVAAIVALTWREGTNGPEPLLQVNTPLNSTREIGKASHVSGYINLRDRQPDDSAPGGESGFTLATATAAAAVARELWDDFSIRDPALAPDLVDVVRFYYPDKENLFFYVFAQEIATDHLFPEAAHMFGWTVEELVLVRKRHVLLNVLSALDAPLTAEQRRRTGALLASNLRVHAEPAFASRVAAVFREGAPTGAIRDDLMQAAHEAQVLKYVAGRELVVNGLAGLQYRAFFTHLLPAYSQIGVSGARELTAGIKRDRDRAAAAEELSVAYQNEQLICSLPIEV